MSDEARAKVETILKNAEVTFSAIYLGERQKGFNGEPWQHDAYSCAFTIRDGTAGHEEFDYFMGIGNRAKATERDKQQAKYDFPGVTQNDITQRTQYGRRYLAAVEKLRKPKAPHPADVLCSLILDSSAAEQTFESWCSDFGYDTDSRKALNTYEACQQNTDKLRRIFTHAQIEALRDALQDY